MDPAKPGRDGPAAPRPSGALHGLLCSPSPRGRRLIPVGSAPHTHVHRCVAVSSGLPSSEVQLLPLHVGVPWRLGPARTPGAGDACWSRSAGGPRAGRPRGPRTPGQGRLSLSCSPLHLARFIRQTEWCPRDRGPRTGRGSHLGEGQGTGWLHRQAPPDSQALGKCQPEVRPPQPGERLCQHAFSAKQTTVWLINL